MRPGVAFAGHRPLAASGFVSTHDNPKSFASHFNIRDWQDCSSSCRHMHPQAFQSCVMKVGGNLVCCVVMRWFSCPPFPYRNLKFSICSKQV